MSKICLFSKILGASLSGSKITNFHIYFFTAFWSPSDQQKERSYEKIVKLRQKYPRLKVKRVKKILNSRLRRRLAKVSKYSFYFSGARFHWRSNISCRHTLVLRKMMIIVRHLRKKPPTSLYAINSMVWI